MNSFSMVSAWSLGFRFVAHRALGHGLILIVLGILVPFALQYAIAGGPVRTMNPAMMGPNPMGSWLGGGGAFLLAIALSYMLQTGSYFASWRLGLGGDRPLVGAILYGLVAGLIAVVVIAVVGVAAGLAAFPFGSSGAGFLAVLIFLTPLIAAFALFYTLLAVLFAAIVLLMLVAVMIYGAFMGDVGLAATLVGGSGGVVVLLLALGLVLIWLAARLSCTAPLMAARKSVNLFAAIAESWRLTWEDQWAVTRYLAAIGFGLALLIFGGAIAIGAGAAAMLQGSPEPELETGGVILGLIVAVPFAFLTVMVPAGIYRELAGSEGAADVFV